MRKRYRKNESTKGIKWVAIFLAMLLLLWAPKIQATEMEDVLTLYAKGAVLLDGDSGRVLYSKNGQEVMPMASTTKIMTCIVALECGQLEDWVTFSTYAASQPKVHLGAKTGRSFRLEDLLYSLMLESHNDTAVAIAEHIGGQIMLSQGLVDAKEQPDSKQAVDAFVGRMNEKAKELGCQNTFFVTPNGLDGSKEVIDESGENVLKSHSTTAEELALIMRYCVYESGQKEKFLEITRKANHSFWDKEGVVCYTCNNHNSLLTQMPQALSGKTGFTNAAGYCYVGALEEGEKKFIVALLACGWPNNKNYKWADCKELFAYGNSNYEYVTFSPKVTLHEILVKNGASLDGNPYSSRKVMPRLENGNPLTEKQYRVLVKQGEQVLARLNQQLYLNAPVTEKVQVGEVEYYRTDEMGREEILERIPLFVQEQVEEIDFRFVLQYVVKEYLGLG